MYQITMHTTTGDHHVFAEEKSDAETIVKRWIYCELKIFARECRMGIDTWDLMRIDALLQQLETDVLAGGENINLDNLIDRLWKDCDWMTGPNGDASFTITRRIPNDRTARL